MLISFIHRLHLNGSPKGHQHIEYAHILAQADILLVALQAIDECLHKHGIIGKESLNLRKEALNSQ